MKNIKWYRIHGVQVTLHLTEIQNILFRYSLGLTDKEKANRLLEKYQFEIDKLEKYTAEMDKLIELLRGS